MNKVVVYNSFFKFTVGFILKSFTYQTYKEIKANWETDGILNGKYKNIYSIYTLYKLHTE